MTKKKTQEEFEEDVFNLVGAEYTVLGKYTRTKDKILMRHNKCGREWLVKANNFITGNSRCNHCRNDNSLKTTDEFRTDLCKKFGNNIKLLDEYKGHTKEIKLFCNKHQIEFFNTPRNILMKVRKNICPLCIVDNVKNTQRKTKELVNEQLEKLHKGNITLEEDYINTHTKVKFKCHNCDNTFKSEPNHVLRHTGCPVCNNFSTSETIIKDFLLYKGIKHEYQKVFDNCRYIKPLRFDFYIENYKGKSIFIEYDGKQHFEPIEYFGGEKQFVIQREKDEIKNNYAIQNNIEMIRIPYTIYGRNLLDYLEKLFDEK